MSFNLVASQAHETQVSNRDSGVSGGGKKMLLSRDKYARNMFRSRVVSRYADAVIAAKFRTLFHFSKCF